MTSADARQADKSRPIHIIDADTHLSEPHDLWVKRAPASLRDRVPQVKKLDDGRIAWVIDGDKSIGDGAPAISAIYKDGSKAQGMSWATLSIPDVHPASWQVKARLEFMDEHDIWAQVVYPNLLGFGGQKSAVVEPNLRLASVQIFNDAMAEMQHESNERLFPMALMPWWDVNLSVQEVERTSDLGLRGVNMNSDPHTAKTGDSGTLPDLASSYWDPLWEICQDRNLPINFHIGGSEQSVDFLGSQGWPSLSRELRLAMGGAMLFFNNGRIMANLIYGGVLDRFPKLKFVSVESGIGWVPFLAQALDYQLGEITSDAKLDLKPSEYFKRNFYACFWFERTNISSIVHTVGVDNVMFETDFPHPTCLYPFDNLVESLPDLTMEEREKVLSLNAASVYSIPLPAVAA